MTSIEKLFEDYKLVGMLTTAMVNHYQEMHNKEIIDAFKKGQALGFDDNPNYMAEQYYQETFKKD
jgi:hypothetical protein